RAGLDYQRVSLDDRAEFVLWLKSPYRSTELLPKEPSEQARANSSINQILTAVAGFYDYLWRQGELPLDLNEQTTRLVQTGGRFSTYKRFLHGISRGRHVRASLLKQKVPKRRPKTCTREEIETLVSACNN